MHLSVFQSHYILGILQMPLIVPHLNMLWFDDMIRAVLTAVSWPSWLRKGDGLRTCCCPPELDLQVLVSVWLDRQGLTCCVLNPTEKKVHTVYLQGEQMFPSNRAKFWGNLQQLKGHVFKRSCRTQAAAQCVLFTAAFQSGFPLHFLLRCTCSPDECLGKMLRF